MKPGDFVRYTPIRGGAHDGRLYTVDRFATASNGEPVVFLREKAGYVARWAVIPDTTEPESEHSIQWTADGEFVRPPLLVDFGLGPVSVWRGEATGTWRFTGPRNTIEGLARWANIALEPDQPPPYEVHVNHEDAERIMVGFLTFCLSAPNGFPWEPERDEFNHAADALPYFKGSELVAAGKSSKTPHKGPDPDPAAITRPEPETPQGGAPTNATGPELVHQLPGVLLDGEPVVLIPDPDPDIPDSVPEPEPETFNPGLSGLGFSHVPELPDPDQPGITDSPEAFFHEDPPEPQIADPERIGLGPRIGPDPNAKPPAKPEPPDDTPKRRRRASKPEPLDKAARLEMIREAARRAELRELESKSLRDISKGGGRA